MAPSVLQPGDYTVLPCPPLPPPVTVVKTIFAGLQLGEFQTIWGVGRTKPVNNPMIHGLVIQNPGAPSSFDFRPVMIAGDNDNLYCMRRLLTQLSPSALRQAKKFSNSVWVQMDDPGSCQAFELDLPTPLNVGTMGLQFLPTSGGNWEVRAFDYPNKKWVTLPGTTFSSGVFKPGIVIGGEYTCDGLTVKHTLVTIGTLGIPVNFTQSCGPSLSPRLNAAFQLDATKDAKPYKIRIDNFQISVAAADAV